MDNSVVESEDELIKKYNEISDKIKAYQSAKSKNDFITGEDNEKEEIQGDIIHFDAGPDMGQENEPAQKQLNVTINEQNREQEPTTPLSTLIHDEEIGYEYPPEEILITQSDEIEISEQELQTNARILQEKLETFKIFIENLSVTPGRL